MAANKHKKRRANRAKPAKKKTNWVNVLALILMLGAIFAYVATLDEGDPDALPSAEGQGEVEAP